MKLLHIIQKFSNSSSSFIKFDFVNIFNKYLFRLILCQLGSHKSRLPCYPRWYNFLFHSKVEGKIKLLAFLYFCKNFQKWKSWQSKGYLVFVAFVFDLCQPTLVCWIIVVERLFILRKNIWSKKWAISMFLHYSRVPNNCPGTII